MGIYNYGDIVWNSGEQSAGGSSDIILRNCWTILN